MKPDLMLPRGCLRPARTDDLDALEALLQDAQVRRYLSDDTILPRDTVAEMLARSDRLNDQGLGLWMIEDTGGTVLGVAGLQPVFDGIEDSPRMTDGIEPIIALAPNQWGQGLAGTALNALIDYACDTLRLTQLVATVDAPNTRSHRLLKRCGFVETGETPGPAHLLVLYKLMFRDTKSEKNGA